MLFRGSLSAAPCPLPRAPGRSDCHGDHKIVEVDSEKADTAHFNSPEVCGSCHLLVLEDWKAGSAHGLAWLEGKEGPVCADCHSSHEIADPTLAPARLASAIERGTFDGRRLIFAGFSDSDGPSTVNARLSLRRAGVVRDAVIAAGAAAPDRIALESVGFGEAMPMACDDSDWGRSVNRRVEVWLD